MLKVSRRIQVRYQAVTSEHTIITVENLHTAITKKLHTIQLKPGLKVRRRNLLCMPFGVKGNELTNQSLSRPQL